MLVVEWQKEERRDGAEREVVHDEEGSAKRPNGKANKERKVEFRGRVTIFTSSIDRLE